MKITGYEFGRIVVEGTPYTSDIVITPSGVKDGWWRREGHSLDREDLTEVIAADPEVVVIGTGYHGRMVVPEETRRYLEARGVRVLAARTGEAVAAFHRLQQECARVVAALHLTC